MLKQEFIDKGGIVGGNPTAYNCSTCTAMFTDPNAFMDHITNGHIGPHLLTENHAVGQLKCPSCPLSFDRTQLLKDHMTRGHNSMPSFSVQAQPIQLGQQLIFHHAQTHQPNSSHLTIPTQTSNSTTAPVTTLDGLYCNQCKNPFANKYSLMKHLRSTRCKIDDEASISRIINEQLTCVKCRHQFGSVQALNKHIEGQKCLQPGWSDSGGEFFQICF